MQPLLLVPLPGPAHGFANAGAKPQVARPRQAAEEALALAARLQQLGARCRLLPPRPCPDLDLQQRCELPALDRLPQEAPWLLPTIWTSPHLGCGFGLPLPGCDRDDGHDRLRLSPEAEPACLTGLPAASLLPPLPAPLRDQGDRHHCRLGRGELPLHLFCCQAFQGMSRSLMPRKRPMRQDKEAQLLNARGLRPGRSVFAGRDWQGIDAGANDCRHLLCGGGLRLFLHERCLLDQSLVVETCTRLLPELRCRVVPKRRITLQEACWHGTFAGLLLPIGDRHLLLVGEHAHDHASTRRLHQSWLDEGLIDELHALPCAQLDPQGGPGRIALDCGPGWPAIGSHDATTIAACRRLVAEVCPQQVSADELADPAFASACRDYTEGLRALLTGEAPYPAADA